ncbi:hypothetical protein [Calycomorphotria hydatis]|uniref:Cytochrome c domain-containing protein n=1 Tax=Calycomorphotria hydatis TaxID=2528027 RepID=A0A517TDX1_9PLAN|nr:hypothetical protein [Calycomorphotria hydatis]QDT66570.1 hypothetical protein V22_38400 [Calycomorphotria hydatis]
MIGIRGLLVVAAILIPQVLLASPGLQALRTHCSACHQDPGQLSGDEGYEGELTYILDTDKMIDAGYVVPGNPADSPIFQRLTDDMPPVGNEPAFGNRRPSDEEVEAVKQYILELAEKKTADRNPLSLGDMYGKIADYVMRQPRRSQRYLRFFSLRVSHNRNEISDERLDEVRLAFAKTLFSLSWQHALAKLTPIDDELTVYAVDLRELDWSSRQWETLIARYPYAQKHDQLPVSAELNQIAHDVYRATQSEVPVVRAEWFIVYASRPPLYHELLGVPDTDMELEQKLGVSAQRNFLNAAVERAGFVRSGISSQNRLVERHANATSGYYWKSYDFKPTSEVGRVSDLLTLPLGPRFQANPFNDVAFVHDGGELIWRLPNGLQGYMLVDGKGGRIDAGPLDVVEDTNGRFSGSSEIVNGISCIGCHKQGMVSLPADEIRGGGRVFGKDRDFLLEIHPTDQELKEILKSDSESFGRALARVYGTIKLKQPRTFGAVEYLEPITPFAKTYIRSLVDVDQLAVELDFDGTGDELRIALKHGNLAFDSLPGFRAVANESYVSRDAIEARGNPKLRFSSTGFQRLSRTLNLGVPVIYPVPK